MVTVNDGRGDVDVGDDIHDLTSMKHEQIGRMTLLIFLRQCNFDLLDDYSVEVINILKAISIKTNFSQIGLLNIS